MERRNFLKTASLGAVASGLTLQAAHSADAPSASPGKIRGFPVLMNPEDDALSVVWVTEGDCVGVVLYGDSPDQLTHTAYSQRHGLATKSHIHQVRLVNLPRGAAVHYRVVTRVTPRAAANLDSSATYAFTLPKADAPKIRFAQINDTHEKLTVIDKLLARIEAIKPDFFLWNGDIFDAVGNDEHIIKNVLLPVDRPFAATIPMVYARGNHDARGNISGLPEYIGMPKDRLYYALRMGPMTMFVLDTAEDKLDAKLGATVCFEQYKDEQTEWLNDELTKPKFANAPVKIAAFHIPFWSRNYWPGVDVRQRWLPALEKHRVNFCISGHIHTYEYLKVGENTTHPTYDPEATPVTIPQLIGGGPSEKEARLILCEVTPHLISIRTEDITAKVVAKHEIKC